MREEGHTPEYWARKLREAIARRDWAMAKMYKRKLLARLKLTELDLDLSEERTGV
jgi:hypothetical protein